MNKILNFIISIFTPRGLKGHSKMSALVALMIFLLEINVLYLPIKSVLLKQVDENLDKSAYTIIFNNIEDTYNVGIEGIKNSGYTIKQGEEFYQLNSNDKAEGINVYSYEYTYNEEKFNVHYVFDVNGTSDKKIEEIYDKFVKVYPNISETLATYISMLIYTEKPETDEALLEKMSFYSQKSEEEVVETLDKLSYFDLYGIDKNDKSYLMLFLKNSFLVEVPSSTEGMYARKSSLYNNISLDMNNINTITNFSKLFAHKIGENLAEEESVYYFGTCLMYVVLFPLIMAGIFCVCLKNRGCLKTFKEFYAVLSMLSIFPTLIGLIATFFVGTGGVMIYSAVLVIYSMIMTYKVIRVND